MLYNLLSWSKIIDFLFGVSKMASLKSGILVKLLEEMNLRGNGMEDEPKPRLLQIRSIIPLLEKGDLWPSRGFYLKVSDLTHAMYVGLPQDQSEMILSNKLKLGEFIYVQKLEPAEPVPMLSGITPVPGRRPCEGTPEDIFPANNLIKFLEASDTDSIVEKGVISEKKITESPWNSRRLARGLSDSEMLIKDSACSGKEIREKVRSLSASKARPCQQKIALKCFDAEKGPFDVLGGLMRSKLACVENDSDSDSTLSSFSSTRMSKRRSWTESEILGVKEIFDSSIVKHEMKPLARSRSATVSPVRSVRYDTSDDNSRVTRRRRDTGSAKKSVKSSTKTKSLAGKIKCEETSRPMDICSLLGDTKGAETRVSWDSLPSNLLNLGKDVLRQRDVAVVAAIEALQEACAAERLIRCLSTYSEFHSSEADDLNPFVDKFFDLEDDLTHTRLIMQSLTNISPLKTSDCSSMGTVKEVLNLAVDRKKNATSWVKSAVALDMSPISNSLKPTTTAVEASKKKLSAAIPDSKPKGMFIARKQRKNSEIPVVLAADKDEQMEWVRGSTISAASDLATTLQDESQRWFLGYVEKYLDDCENKTSSMESDNQIAGMMHKVKRVNDWLNMIISKEASFSKDECKEGSTMNEVETETPFLNDTEKEACGRVRNKIYGLLLKHVEKTALALENMNASA